MKIKELREDALSAYSAYKKATSDWNINRGKLRNEIKAYLKDVNKDLCSQCNLDEQSIFNVCLDGGSATLNWDINDNNIWCSTFHVKSGDDLIFYNPTVNDSWIVSNSEIDNEYTEIEDKSSPLTFVVLNKKIQEIKRDLDMVATIYKSEIDYPHARVTLIDGTVIEPVQREDEYDYED